MKTFFTILLLSIACTIFSQTIIDTAIPSSPKNYMNIVSYYTPNKDTLFLQNNDIGRSIKKLWEDDKTYSGIKPKIVIVDDILSFIESRKPKMILSGKK